MPKTKIIDIDNFGSGLRVLEDSADAPVGSARVMTNMLISDRGGLSKRPGTRLLGSFSASSSPCTGFYVYNKAFGRLQVPVRSYGAYTEYYHPLAGWSLLESGFTEGSEFGFREHIRNVDNEDYLYMCNRTEYYRRWPGSYTQVTSALSGGETSIPVGGTLKDQVFHSAAATFSTATTVQVAGAGWAGGQWANFYVYFPGTGDVRRVTASTADTLTFDALGAPPGSVPFEIRLAAFPPSGTLVVGGVSVDYSGIPTSTSFSVASAPATAQGAPVTLRPTSYPGAPRGNRLEVNLDRMLVGNVASGVSRDGSGNVQGSSAPLSVYVSKLRDASDFGYDAARIAGQGDIVSFPEGSANVNDVANQEENWYAFTDRSITAVQYSQDSNDVAIKTPLKGGIGAVGRVIKGENDIYFVTKEKVISSIGRVLAKDSTPQADGIGLVIKRLTDGFEFDRHAGRKFRQRIFHTCRSGPDAGYNDRTIVYNEATRSYEGLWTLGAHGFDEYGGRLHFASSRNPNVYEMFAGTADDDGTATFPISSQWLSNWVNLTPSKANLQSVSAVYAEGFIWGGTQSLAFDIYKDYNSNSSFSFTFGIGDARFLDDTVGLNGYFGGLPLGTSPIGALGGVQSDGSRHFSFVIYFPYLYSNHFSIGIRNSEKTAKFDVTHLGLAVEEEPEYAATRVLSN